MNTLRQALKDYNYINCVKKFNSELVVKGHWVKFDLLLYAFLLTKFVTSKGSMLDPLVLFPCMSET